jgi:hypothetical protein
VSAKTYEDRKNAPIGEPNRYREQADNKDQKTIYFFVGFSVKAIIDVGMQRFRTMNIFFKGNSRFRGEILQSKSIRGGVDFRKQQRFGIMPLGYSFNLPHLETKASLGRRARVGAGDLSTEVIA